MAIPSKKDPAIENIIDALNPSGRKRIPSIRADIYTWCGKPATDFRNDISRREYTISGMCQKCQDDFFGRD